MKKNSWIILFTILLITYFLSSIPGLSVLPVLKQINFVLNSVDMGYARVAVAISSRLPTELGSARAMSGDIYSYARENPIIMEFFLRKMAHIFLFFAITMAFFFLIRHYIKKPWAITASFFAGTIMAVLDEYHQYFVSNRVGSVVDVGIDMIGVSMATIVIIMAHVIAKPISFKRKKKQSKAKDN